MASTTDRWTGEYRKHLERRRDEILSDRRLEYTDVFGDLGLQVVEFLAPEQLLDGHATDPSSEAVGAMVTLLNDGDDEPASVVLAPHPPVTNVGQRYDLAAVGPCRYCGRSTKLAPTVTVQRDVGTVEQHHPYGVTLGQALTHRYPRASHDCNDRGAPGDDAASTGQYL